MALSTGGVSLETAIRDKYCSREGDGEGQEADKGVSYLHEARCAGSLTPLVWGMHSSRLCG